MGADQSQDYALGLQWVSISKSPWKELIQHRQTGKLVEKHIRRIEADEDIKQDKSVFEWRGNKKKAGMIVEVMAVSYEEDLPESECQYSMCPGESRNVFLVVCTERLNKLYEHNPKIDIDRRCQASIFWDIIEGVNNIASHFGFFKISKEMVGYNSDLKGKAWMNENYSSHKAGQPCHSLQRDNWQGQIIASLVQISTMCINSKSVYRSKFHAVVQDIQNNKICTFSHYNAYFKRLIHAQKRCPNRPSPVRRQNSRSDYHQSDVIYMNVLPVDSQMDSQAAHSPLNSDAMHSNLEVFGSKCQQMGCSNTTSTFKIETLSPQQPVKIVNQLVPQIVVVNRVGNQGHFSMNQGMRDMSRLSIVSCQSNNNHRNFVEVNKREGRSFERSPARLVQQHSVAYPIHRMPSRPPIPYPTREQPHRPQMILQQILQEQPSRQQPMTIRRTSTKDVEMVDSMIFYQQEEIESGECHNVVLEESIILQGNILNR